MAKDPNIHPHILAISMPNVTTFNLSIEIALMVFEYLGGPGLLNFCLTNKTNATFVKSICRNLNIVCAEAASFRLTGRIDKRKARPKVVAEFNAIPIKRYLTKLHKPEMVVPNLSVVERQFFTARAIAVKGFMPTNLVYCSSCVCYRPKCGKYWRTIIHRYPGCKWEGKHATNGMCVTQDKNVCKLQCRTFDGVNPEECYECDILKEKVVSPRCILRPIACLSTLQSTGQ